MVSYFLQPAVLLFGSVVVADRTVASFANRECGTLVANVKCLACASFNSCKTFVMDGMHHACSLAAVLLAVALFSSRWQARSWSSHMSQSRPDIRRQTHTEPSPSSQMKREAPGKLYVFCQRQGMIARLSASTLLCRTNKHYQKMVHAVGAGQGTHKKLEKYHPNAPRNRPKETVSHPSS